MDARTCGGPGCSRRPRRSRTPRRRPRRARRRCDAAGPAPIRGDAVRARSSRRRVRAASNSAESTRARLATTSVLSRCCQVHRRLSRARRVQKPRAANARDLEGIGRHERLDERQGAAGVAAAAGLFARVRSIDQHHLRAAACQRRRRYAAGRAAADHGYVTPHRHSIRPVSVSKVRRLKVSKSASTAPESRTRDPDDLPRLP